jgi:hypothetical protein
VRTAQVGIQACDQVRLTSAASTRAYTRALTRVLWCVCVCVCVCMSTQAEKEAADHKSRIQSQLEAQRLSALQAQGLQGVSRGGMYTHTRMCLDIHA